MCNKYRPETQNFLTSLFHSWTYHRIPWPRADLLAFQPQCHLFFNPCTALELKVWTSPTAPELKLFGVLYRPETQKMGGCVHLATVSFNTGSSLWPDKEECLPLKHIVYALPHLPPWNSIIELSIPPQNSKFWCLIPPWNSTLTERQSYFGPYSLIIRNHFHLIIKKSCPFISLPIDRPITQRLH